MSVAHQIAPRERVIVALDVPDLAQLEALLDRLEGQPVFYKVGLELFVSAGARAVEVVRARGGRVFLDLKLHDIPETVARAAASAARLGIELLTVHASGGSVIDLHGAPIPLDYHLSSLHGIKSAMNRRQKFIAAGRPFDFNVQATGLEVRHQIGSVGFAVGVLAGNPGFQINAARVGHANVRRAL